MGRMNQASQEGTDRYLDWYDRFPLTKDVVEEMYHGQCKVLNHLIFNEGSDSLSEQDIEDKLIERFRKWLKA